MLVLTLYDPRDSVRVNLCENKEFRSKEKLCDYVNSFFADHDKREKNPRKKLGLGMNALLWIVNKDERYRPKTRNIPIESYIFVERKRKSVSPVKEENIKQMYEKYSEEISHNIALINSKIDSFEKISLSFSNEIIASN